MKDSIQMSAAALAAGQSQSAADGESGWLDGGEGDDRLIGGAGADILLGGAGNDLILGGAGDDHIAGDDEGQPVARYLRSLAYRVAHDVATDANGNRTYTYRYSTVNEVVRRPGGDDVIYGGAGADWIFGQGGDDYLDGGTGDDVIHGEEIVPREDVFRMTGGPTVNWRIETGAMSDFAVGGVGNDVIAGGDDLLAGGDWGDAVRIEAAVLCAVETQSPQHGDKSQSAWGGEEDAANDHEWRNAA